MTAEPLNVIKPQQIQPFQVRQGLIGLDFDGTSEALLKYLHFFATKVPFEAAFFLHVLPKHNLFNLETEDETVLLPGTSEIDKDLSNKLKREVETCFQHLDVCEVKGVIVEGDPLEELVETADKIRADLVVIGQHADGHHHGILAKNFARQVWSNALLVPSKAKPSLKKILVPVDFSPNSAEALRAAVAINMGLDKPVKITVIHNYHLPANFSAYRFNQARVMEMVEEDRVTALDAFIAEHVPESALRYVEPALLKNNHFSIGQHIQAFAEQHKFDLIVMGAKGHSKVALLLLGSVTEKVLSLTKRVPVLIIR